jgi:hypothetical protein
MGHTKNVKHRKAYAEKGLGKGSTAKGTYKGSHGKKSHNRAWFRTHRRRWRRNRPKRVG